MKTLWKNSRKGIEGTFLKLIKNIYKTPTANIILNDETMDSLTLNTVTKQGSPLAIPIQHCTGTSSKNAK